MWGKILMFAINLLAGLGAGAVLDKAVPDANLNVTKDIVTSQAGSGGGVDWMKILKYIAISVLTAFIVSKVAGLLGFKKFKLF
jgi:hypothetical protein